MCVFTTSADILLLRGGSHGRITSINRKGPFEVLRPCWIRGLGVSDRISDEKMLIAFGDLEAVGFFMKGLRREVMQGRTP